MIDGLTLTIIAGVTLVAFEADRLALVVCCVGVIATLVW
jgi:hypothetical protein